jgi:hypothetical protein
MRKRWLAALPLLVSCADNLPDAVVGEARLEDFVLPDLIVAGWPEALEVRVQADTPGEGPWSVELRVSGPGLDTPVDFLLRDDGDYGVLTDPGPGQEPASGDNVAGDGWFTTRLSADFVSGLGDFTLRARLLRDGEEVDAWAETRTRRENLAPAILDLDGPATLASGGTFTLHLRAADPDGSEDLQGASLVQNGGVMRSWSFTRTGDSLFTVVVGPELAAGRQGPDTLAVTLQDRAGQSVAQDWVVELENGPPLLDVDAFQLWRWQDEGQTWLPEATSDTLTLLLPAAGSAYFQLSLPVADPQTAADIQRVEWSIARTTVPFNQLVWYSMVDTGPGEDGVDWVEGDGRYSSAFQLPWDAPVAERHLRIRVVDRVGQEAPLADWVLLVAPAAGGAPVRPAGPAPCPAWRIQP